MIRGLDWAVRLLRWQRETEEPARDGGGLALDGESAVALLALEMGCSAGLKSGDSRATATRVWRRAATSFDPSAVSPRWSRSRSVEDAGPRGALAAAIGLAMAGERATAFVCGPDLDASGALLHGAAARPLPLVVHLSASAPTAHASARGTGHEVLGRLRDAGWIVLVARNVQDAVDLSVLARRVTERALVPAIVVMDRDQTAAALQDVRIPTREDLDTYLGAPGDEIPSATPAQELIYGEFRRRVPRGFDLDRPLLHGGVQGPESWAAGAVSRGLFVLPHVDECLVEGRRAFAEVFGREVAAVTVSGRPRAKVVLAAQGATVEEALAVARRLHEAEKLAVRVVGLQTYRPFPAREIVDAVLGAETVLILERVSESLDSEPPLTAELRALFDRCRENHRTHGQRHPGLPSVLPARLPRIVSVRYGLGGAALPAVQLEALCRTHEALDRSEVVLGWTQDEPNAAEARLPKQQALRDAVRRRYPELGEFGLPASDAPPRAGAAKRASDSLRAVVHRLHRQGGEAWVPMAADLFLQMRGGVLRSRIAEADGAWGTACTDRFELGSRTVDTDSAEPAQLAVVAWNGAPSARSVQEGLAHRIAVPAVLQPWKGVERGGALLVCASGSDAEIVALLPPQLCRELASRQISLHVVPRDDAPGAGEERLLGASVSLLQVRASGVSIKKARSAFRDRLESLRAQGVASDAEVARALREFERGLSEVRALDLSQGDAGSPTHEAMSGTTLDVTLDVTSDATSDTTPNVPLDARATASAYPETLPPFAVRQMTRTDQRLDSLPRFWDHVGVLYNAGAPESLRPDPYLATGAVPPLSASFRDVSGAHATIPRFDPTTCTGCAECWPVCPDGALAPVVLGFAQILETGMTRAKQSGADPTALRPIVSKLSAQANGILAGADPVPSTAGEVLEAAMERVLEAMAAPAERRRTLESAFAPVLAGVRDFQVARTKPFFFEPESASVGSGQILSLAIDPGACKGCQSCVRACAYGALTAELQTPAVRDDRVRGWDLWQSMPDTAGQTIRRAGAHAEVGPLAAGLLSRHSLLAMSGGDGAEAGSGEKLALRLVLAIIETTLQPRLLEQITQLEGLSKTLEDAMKQTLTGSLPAEDLEVLAKGLRDAGGPRADLSSLAARLQSDAKGKGLDAARLQSLVSVAQTLRGLRETLARGVNGFGRSRYSLVFGNGSIAEWAAEFPLNPFQVPVIVDASGEVCATARGLMEGQLAQAAEVAKVARHAHVLLENPPDAAARLAALEGLTWRDLDAEERRFCPPVVVVVDERTVGETLGALTPLLEADVPIRVLVLSGVGSDFGRDLSGRPRRGRALGSYVGPGILALTNRRAFVHQSSVAHRDHLHRGVVAALESTRPALIHVFAPSPQRHGFDADGAIAQSLQAVRSRVVPLFTYDPDGEGVFGSRIDLTGNPALTEPFFQDEHGCPLTPIDWALGQDRFAGHFRPVADDAPSPVSWMEYLALSPRERIGRTPFRAVTVDRLVVRLEVSPEMVEFAEHHLGVWTTLQELAGVRTPFTARVEAEARERLESSYAAEAAVLRREHQAQLATLRAQMEDEMTQRVGSRLLELARRGAALREEER